MADLHRPASSGSIESIGCTIGMAGTEWRVRIVLDTLLDCLSCDRSSFSAFEVAPVAFAVSGFSGPPLFSIPYHRDQGQAVWCHPGI
jgi:hypothetical protein